MSELFTPYSLKNLTLRNRIAVPPMCQYMAEDGVPNDWHLVHYPSMARGGAGLVIVEATAVSPEGRISPNCLGIWNDEQAAQHAKIAKSIKDGGAVAGLQIGHAGIKGSASRPWDGDAHIDESDPQGWETIGPSPIAMGGKLNKVPREMSIDDIKRVQGDFVSAAKRALDAGYEWLELHYSHGYLAQSFFSVHTNKREDEYGGSFENRARFLVETLKAVREVWPDEYPLTARLGVIEFDGRDEETLEEAIKLVKILKENGLDFLNVSMGFTTLEAKIPWKDAPFMGPIAKRVRDEAGVPVASAWGFGTPELAENAITSKEMNLVMVGRSHLANPHWVFEAAEALGVEKASWVMPAPYAHWASRYS